MTPQVSHPRRAGHLSTWLFRAVDPQKAKSLWLRYSLLESENGFRQICDVTAIAFSRNEQKETDKIAVRQTFAKGSFQPGPKIGPCTLSPQGTEGIVQGKGRTIEWKLTYTPEVNSSFSSVPESLARIGIIRNRSITSINLARGQGILKWDQNSIDLSSAHCLLHESSGQKSLDSWAWGQCNSFTDEQGRPSDTVFEGLTAQFPTPLRVLTPSISCFYIRHQGQDFVFNHLRDALKVRSNPTLSDWQFELERGDYQFRGKIKAQFRDFAGLTYEDTDGSILYASIASLAEMELVIYRRGKIEANLKAPQSAAFEWVSREKNPYVPTAL